MNPILKWLNRPYPYEGTWHESMRSSLYGGLFVFLFLVIFRPFGIGGAGVNFWKLALVCSYFGLVTSAVLLLLSLSMRIVPSFFREDGWVIWKEILTNVLVIAMIGFGNMLLATFLFGQKLTVPVFWAWQKVTLSIAFFPIFFTAYTKQQLLQKKHTRGAHVLNEKIAGHHEEIIGNEPIIQLTGDNQNETLECHPTDLLYMEAADNYVRIFYKKNNGLTNVLLRSTLKKMEQQLDTHEQFYRCHRTYLINLNKVKQVSGNAQGYKLHLENCEKPIPVSRSLNGEIVERFK
ncbi:MAG: LytTR family DNA-binding domain-containing protein [Bacteroidota bacterium]